MDHIILMPGQAAVESCRKRAARGRSSLSFGGCVETPESWLDRLWGVWGDGRAVATKTQRMMAIMAALEHSDDLASSAGSAAMLLRLADEGMGASRFDDALREGVPQRGEFDLLLAALRDYERVLSARRLIDPGRAWELLGRRKVICRPASLRVRGMSLPASIREFCATQANLTIEEEPPAEVGPVDDGVDVRFAFPSGRHARPLLLIDVLLGMLEGDCREGDVVVTARDPLSLYEEIAPALACEGVPCGFEGSAAFRGTDFGRAVFRVRDILSEESNAVSCTDFLLSPFSGVSNDAAYAFDAWARADRLLCHENLVERVRSISSTFEYFEEIVSTPDASVLLGMFEDRIRGMADAGESYRSEQLAALSAMRGVCEDARLMGVGMEACFDILDSVRIASARVMGDGNPKVRVMGLDRAAMLGAGSCSGIVMCDMTSAAYPLRERSDAAEELLREVGVKARSSLSDARRTFSLAASLPTRSLVIERCLNDENAAPTYPAAVVEEFVDCYRADPTDSDEVDNRYSLPERFVARILERGEDRLYENAAVRKGGQPVVATVEKPSLERVSKAASTRLVLPRILPKGRIMDAPCFSASQIESYLECPQKWFAMRRLRLDELDEGFGAVEMGNFSHRALERFYRRFQEEVAPKVTTDLLPVAREIMRETIEELRVEQYGEPSSSNRLVPVGELERRQVDELSDRLVSFLDREARLLPDFHPAYFEFSISAENAVDYAGRKLIGAIDRIDVDGEGHAVVVDYKSALSSDYDLYDSAGEERGGKVQALIYSQAVRRMLGLDVVGALYVGYGRSGRVSGAMDLRVEPLHVPGIRTQSCVFGNGPLSDLIDATEERVSRALDALLSGCVEPRPAHAGVCSFCPEISCPQRKG